MPPIATYGGYFKDRSILITGGTVGTGRDVLLMIALDEPGQIFMTTRDPEKAAPTARLVSAVSPTTEVHVVQCDLGSKTSIFDASVKINTLARHLNYFFACASVPARDDDPVTVDGHDRVLAVNYLGHVALFKLVMLEMTFARWSGEEARFIMGYDSKAKMPPELYNLPETTSHLPLSTRHGISHWAKACYAREFAESSTIEAPNDIFVLVVCDDEPLWYIWAAVEPRKLKSGHSGVLNGDAVHFDLRRRWRPFREMCRSVWRWTVWALRQEVSSKTDT